MIPPPPRLDRSPILVTGAHRSGTSWVGQMLAAGPGIAYINEPFNLDYRRPGIYSAPIRHWFEYVAEGNEEPHLGALAKTLRLEYDLGAGLRAVRAPREAARLVRDWSQTTRHRRAGARPLMKDPIAFFAAEWLADRFGMDVVVLVRHPAAFVSSLLRVGWWLDLRHFLDQPLLMRDLLAPYEAEISAQVGREKEDLVRHAVLLWKVIYGVALGYRERHPDWLFVRHEDLSRNPVAEFRRLFERLGIAFTPEVQATIEAHSGTENPAEAEAGRVHQLRRDSRANIWTWADRLGPEEVEQVRHATAGVADAFYTAADWVPPSGLPKPHAEASGKR